MPLYVDVRLSHTNTRIYEQVIERDKAIAALKEAQAQAETLRGEQTPDSNWAMSSLQKPSDVSPEQAR